MGSLPERLDRVLMKVVVSVGFIKWGGIRAKGMQDKPTSAIGSLRDSAGRTNRSALGRARKINALRGCHALFRCVAERWETPKAEAAVEVLVEADDFGRELERVMHFSERKGDAVLERHRCSII
jgi:hypothetical protein